MEGVLRGVCYAGWKKSHRQDTRPCFTSDSEMERLRSDCTGRTEPVWMLQSDSNYQPKERNASVGAGAYQSDHPKLQRFGYTTIRKYSIEDSPAWKRLYEKFQ